MSDLTGTPEHVHEWFGLHTLWCKDLDCRGMLTAEYANKLEAQLRQAQQERDEARKEVKRWEDFDFERDSPSRLVQSVLELMKEVYNVQQERDQALRQRAAERTFIAAERKLREAWTVLYVNDRFNKEELAVQDKQRAYESAKKAADEAWAALQDAAGEGTV